MKKVVNGKIVVMTEEEIERKRISEEAFGRKVALMERSRPLTAEEVSRMLLTQQVNALEVDDNTALRMKEFYPEFKDIVGQTVKKGFKFTYADKLWRTEQPEMTIQEHYPPAAGTESLYSEVCETHAGTLEDPIPYGGGMVLEEGKFYYEEYVLYRCFRGSGNPVYHALAELVGLYVEEV